MVLSIVELGAAVVVPLIGCAVRRYVGSVAERRYKHEVTYLDPDGVDKDYSKWSWEFWR